MAGIKEPYVYQSKVCGSCGYSWSFPVFNFEKLTPLERLSFIHVHQCPTCFCVGEDITKVGEFEKKIQNDKEYKKILQTRNMPFTFVSKNESYVFALYAYMSKVRKDMNSYVKASILAGIVEKNQRLKYIKSLSYNANTDVKLIQNSEATERAYYSQAKKALETLIQNKDDVNYINYNLMYAYVLKLLGDNDACIEKLNAIAKQKLDQNQIATIKQIVGA